MNDLFTRLASDERLGLSAKQFDEIFQQGRANSGDAAAQVDAFAARVDALAAKHPDAARYEPGVIL